MEEQQMDENKRLAIALGAPTVLLLGGLLGGGVSGAGSPPASVALTEANESFSTQLSAVEESTEEEMDPEVEKILYPYRKTEEAEASTSDTPPASEPTPTSEVATTDDSPEPEIATVTETNTLKPVVEGPAELESVDPEPASPPIASTPVETASVETAALAETASESPTIETVALEDPAVEVGEVDAIDPEPASAPESVIAAIDEPDVTSDLLADEFAETADEPAELALADSAIDPVPPAPATIPEDTEELLVVDSVDPEMAPPPEMAVTVQSEQSAVDEPTATEPVTAEPTAPSAVATETVAATETTETESDATPSELPTVSETAPGVTPVAYKPKPATEGEPVANAEKKPFLGVGFRDPSKSIVTTLYGNSTAQRMGIMLGDEIVSANGTKISDLASLKGLLQSLSAGDKVSIQIKRGKATFDLPPYPLGSK